MSLPKEDQETLLQAARAVLEEALKMRRPLTRTEWVNAVLQSFRVSDNSARAVFVTLLRAGSLRGCVGSTEPEIPLLEAVALNALKSAFEDPRFPPLTPEELSEIDIEISVLSPMEKIKSHDAIVPHLHGVFIKNGLRSGVFLPQVWKQIQFKEKFLSELCFSKAGLNPDAWKEPETEIFVFTVEHFSESEINPPLSPNPSLSPFRKGRDRGI